MDASIKEEDRTTSMMKCVLHIVRSRALNDPEPQAQRDIIGNFIFIYHGVCAKDLLPISEQMVEIKVFPSGTREVSWKGIHGGMGRKYSPLFTTHPECDINRYRASETCAKHRFKYLRPPRSTLGTEGAKLTKRCVASVRSEDNLVQRLSNSGTTSELRVLNLKYPNDKVELVSKNEFWFKCHDYPSKLYKVSQGENCIYYIRCHIEGAAQTDRVESRVTRNGETTITTKYVQVGKEILEKVRGKDPIVSRWTWWLDEYQAPKCRDGTVANEENLNGTSDKKSAVAGPSTTPPNPEKCSGDINLDSAGAIIANKRAFMEPESSYSSNKRTRLAQSHDNISRSTLVIHPKDSPDSPDGKTQANDGTSSNHTQPQFEKDQPLDAHDGTERKATKSARSKAIKARVRILEAELYISGKTTVKISKKLHKQRKIAATQQEILEHLVKENKRHSVLVDSLRVSLNIAHHQLSTIKSTHNDGVTRLKGNIKFLRDGRIVVKAVSDEHTTELEELRKRLQILEKRDLGAEDKVQKRASRLRDLINGDK